MSETMWPVVEAIMPHSRRTLLYGPPGTGKTYAALRAVTRKDQPVFSVTCTEEMPAAELRGHYMPNDAGTFSFHYGAGSNGWKLGGVIVLNEINRLGGDGQTYCLNLCDDPESAVLTLPNGESIRPHADTKIIATMNGDPSDLDEALRSRFPVAIKIDRPHPDAIAKLPADLQRSASNTTLADDPDRRINLRTWYAFAELRSKVGGDVAALACFGVRAKEVLTALKVGGA